MLNLKIMWRKYMQHMLKMNVKDKHKILHTRQKLSLLYAFLGWNCFGIVFYLIVKDKIPTNNMERRMSYRYLTGVSNNMHVLQISGLKLTKKFDIVYNTEKEKEIVKIEEITAKVDKY